MCYPDMCRKFHYFITLLTIDITQLTIDITQLTIDNIINKI